MFFKILVVFLLANLVCAEEAKEDDTTPPPEEFYTENDAITIFKSADEFKKTVLESGEIWLVEMYVPWCGMCK